MQLEHRFRSQQALIAVHQAGEHAGPVGGDPGRGPGRLLVQGGTLALQALELGRQIGGGEAVAVGIAPLQDAALYLPHLILQIGVVPQGRRGPQRYHGLEDILIQPGGRLHIAALGGGILEQLDLHGQPVQLGLVGPGPGCPGR